MSGAGRSRFRARPAQKVLLDDRYMLAVEFRRPDRSAFPWRFTCLKQTLDDVAVDGARPRIPGEDTRVNAVRFVVGLRYGPLRRRFTNTVLSDDRAADDRGRDHLRALRGDYLPLAPVPSITPRSRQTRRAVPTRCRRGPLRMHSIRAGLSPQYRVRAESPISWKRSRELVDRLYRRLPIVRAKTHSCAPREVGMTSSRARPLSFSA